MSDNTYIRMLIESQEKKMELLDEALDLDREQLELIHSG